MKKGFLIDLVDTIPNNPTDDFICRLIEKQCNRDNEKVVFIQREKPIRFCLNDQITYEATLTLTNRACQLVFCKEI